MRFDKKIDVIKNDILGKEYSLSIAYAPEEKSRELNKKYRKKDKATNVLSFSLRKDLGELVLCKAVIAREAKKLGKTKADWLGFLVIHGMLHLKGLKHSATMERLEKKYDQKYNGRNRHGIFRDPSRDGGVRKRRKKS